MTNEDSTPDDLDNRECVELGYIRHKRAMVCYNGNGVSGEHTFSSASSAAELCVEWQTKYPYQEFWLRVLDSE